MGENVIILLIAGGFVVLGYVWYVVLIRRRNTAREALASVDVHLRKRHDLIPNAIAVAERFMEHEKELFSSITRLRAQASEAFDSGRPEQIKEHLAVENQLQAALGQLFYAVNENYPDLRSSDHMQEVLSQLEDTESNIAAARRFYNATVTDLNNAVEIFPGSVIAGMAKVQSLPFFEETDDTVRAPVDVSAHFS